MCFIWRMKQFLTHDIFSVIDCGHPCPPTNGYVNYTTITLHSKAVYTCNGGCRPANKTSTSVTATCNVGGVWSETAVICPGSIMIHIAKHDL